MAAFIGHGGQFVETVSQAGGVERESDGQAAGARGDVKMIAGLEVGQVGIEAYGSGWAGAETG